MHALQPLMSFSSLSTRLKPEKARHHDIVKTNKQTKKSHYGQLLFIKTNVNMNDISSHIQSETPQKRRAESAGTFIIASEILKPRRSHSRESRLSKMQLVLMKSTCEDLHCCLMRTVPSFSFFQDKLFWHPASLRFYQSLNNHRGLSGSIRWPHYIQVCRREV